jgi:outer membrane protein OmpA-like peptidoglycan-associated protein
MRAQAFALVLALVAALGAFPAVAQQPETTGRQSDLIFSVQYLWARISDLSFVVDDLGGKATNVAGAAQNLEVKETATEIRIELAADVLFDFDKATIKPEAASALHNVALIIRDRGNGRAVRIDGHTDGKGSASYNQGLSERRAESVKQWLAQKEGVPQARMTTRGFGATKPVVPNIRPDGSDSPEGRQKNRRVEIVLAK